ncbi:hypothetical protein [Thermofilum sp.]|uniref:hypothetical protein n=1 Tax=Thermofilum sp. TaxID=1961369 RepID=UPI003171CE13
MTNVEAYMRAKQLAKKASFDTDTIAQIAKYLEDYVNSLPPQLQNVAIAQFNGKVYTRKDLPILFMKDKTIQQIWLEKLRL